MDDALRKTLWQSFRKWDIASLPVVAVKVIQLVGKETSSIEDLRKIISFDISFASRLLRVANSPYYNRGAAVNNIADAILRIGFETVKSIVVAASLKDMHRKSDALDRSLWEHSTAVSIASTIIAYETKIVQAGEVLLPGLLHDIGKMIINMNLKEEYKAIADHVSTDKGASFDSEEKKAFGFTHCDVGEFTGEIWKLPDSVIYVVANHHNPVTDLSKKEDKAVLVVRAANVICSEMGFGMPGGGVTITADEMKALRLNDQAVMERVTSKIEEEYPQYKNILMGQ